jgi:hypothetical protein
MFDFHECKLEIQKYKNLKTDTLCVTLGYTKNQSESCLDSDTDSESKTLGGGVVVVRHRFFNRYLDVTWEKTVLIHLQTLFQLQVVKDLYMSVGVMKD